MGLHDTKKELYEKETDLPQKRKQTTVYNVNAKKQPFDITEEEQIGLEEENKKSSRRVSKKSIFIGVLVIALIGTVVSLAVFLDVFRMISFDEDRVSIEFSGPTEVGSGETTVYTLRIDNDNLASLSDVRVVVQYPFGFVPQENTFTSQDGNQRGIIQIGDFSGGAKKEIPISGKFLGGRGEDFYIQTFLEYGNNSGTGRFTKETQKSIKLLTSSVGLSVASTLEATPGEQVEYLVEYRNDTPETIYNARIIATISSFFDVISVEPNFSQKDLTRLTWELGTLNAGEEGEVRIRGAYFQEVNSKGVFDVELGYPQGDGTFYALSQEEVVTSIIPSLLSMQIQSSTGDVVRVGEGVSFTLNYKNTGDVGLPSGVVQASFDGEIWDFDSLSLRNANWNPETETITWRAADVPELQELAPQEEGSLNFSLQAKQRIDVSGANDSNFEASVQALVDSPDALSRLGLENVSGRDEVEMKLQTFVDITFEVEEKDSGDGLNVIRFEEDVPVELDVRIRLENPYNDVTNGRLRMNIPGEVEWVGFMDGSEEETKHFDERNKILEWDIGKMDAGTGVYRDARELGFTIKFTPRAYQNGTRVPVLSGIDFSGRDMFIQEDIIFSLEDRETRVLRW